MPNWCENRLRIHGPAAEVERFLTTALDWNDDHPSEPCRLALRRLLPTPPEIPRHPNPDLLSEEEWEWRVKHWGTKWEPDVFEKKRWARGTCGFLAFDTAWVPPLAALESLSRQFPALSLRLFYREEGNGIYGKAHFGGETA